MPKQPKIYAFIDSQNLNLSVRNNVKRKGATIYRGWQLDFRKFRIYLKDKYSVSRAFLFIGKVKGNEDLYRNLESYGYNVIYKPTLECIGDDGEPHTKGNVDAELVLHTMIQLPNYDKAIIVSGDGDYFCLIEYLEKKGKLLRVVIPNKFGYSRLLRPFYKYMVFVTDLESSLRK